MGLCINGQTASGQNIALGGTKAAGVAMGGAVVYRVAAAAAPPVERIPCVGVRVDGVNQLELKKGKSIQLVATLTPANTTDVLKWSTLHSTIATVDQTGKVTGVAAGTTLTTATCNGYNQKITTSIM